MHFLSIIFISCNYLQHFADLKVTQYVTKQIKWQRVTARLPHQIPHLLHHKLTVCKFLAIRIRLPAQTVNVSIHTRAQKSSEVLLPLTWKTQLSMQNLRSLSWKLFSPLHFLWIYLETLNWALMFSHLVRNVSIKQQLQWLDLHLTTCLSTLHQVLDPSILWPMGIVWQVALNFTLNWKVIVIMFSLCYLDAIAILSWYILPLSLSYHWGTYSIEQIKHKQWHYNWSSSRWVCPFVIGSACSSLCFPPKKIAERASEQNNPFGKMAIM